MEAWVLQLVFVACATVILFYQIHATTRAQREFERLWETTRVYEQVLQNTSDVLAASLQLPPCDPAGDTASDTDSATTEEHSGEK
jgi:hypothetical protein